MSITEHHAAHFADNQANWDDRAHSHMSGNYGGHEQLLADPTFITPELAQDIFRFGDLSGKNVLHLQCHVGTDTICFPRLGARRTVGLDLSPDSLHYAQQLSDATSAQLELVQSNVYDARATVDGHFDLVYTSLGVLCWLPDIDAWAQTVASLVAPGGQFFIRDDHPMFMTIDEDTSHGLLVTQPYFQTTEPLTWESDTSYTNDADAPPISHSTNHQWNHSLGQTLTALIKAGLIIDDVEETEYSAWCPWPELMVEDNGRWRLRDNPQRLPLQFAIHAHKPVPSSLSG